MSKKELGRGGTGAGEERGAGVVDAAQLLRVSYRQAKRLWKRFREEGATGVPHRSAGRPSNRAHDKKFRKKVLRRERGPEALAHRSAVLRRAPAAALSF